MPSILAILSALFASVGVVAMASSSSDDGESNDSDNTGPTDEGAPASSDDDGGASEPAPDGGGDGNPGPDAGSGDDSTSPPATSTASESAYYGVDGALVLQAESADVDQGSDWVQTTMDGETVLLWDADRSSYRNAPENEALSYEFQVEESGTYTIALHGGRDYDVMNDSDRYENGEDGEQRTDTGNDVYVKITNLDTGEVIVDPTKLYIGLGGANEDLRWGSTFDTDEGHSNSEVQLEAGVNYGLEIIGRSDGFALDMVTLEIGRSGLEDADAEESPLLTDFLDTVAEAELAASSIEEDDDMVEFV